MSIKTASKFSLPGPHGLPAIGWLYNTVRFMQNPTAQLIRLSQYGPLVGLTQGSTKYVFVFSPEYNQLLFSDTTSLNANVLDATPFTLPKNEAFSHLFAGVPVLNGEKHKQIRHLMAPAFHTKRVESYHTTMVSLTEQKLDTLIVGRNYDILQEMKQLTLSIAVKTLLGIDPNVEEIGYLVEQWLSAITSLSTLLLPIDVRPLPFHRLMMLSTRLEEELINLIAYKRKYAEAGNDILADMINVRDENDGKLSDNELIGQTMALFVAGYETTANALAWTLFLLAQHPAILEEVVDELKKSLKGSAPTTKQLSGLKMVDAVIKESLRLLPPIPWRPYVSTTAINLEPYVIPSGAVIVYSPFATHRSANLYSQPNDFLPSRWYNYKAPPYTYIPFGLGSHSCIGSNFAIMEMKVILATLLQRHSFNLQPNARIELSGLVFSTLKYGLPMSIGLPERHTAQVPVRGNIRNLVCLNKD